MKKRNTYCQSCGMPLGIEGKSQYGTNSDGKINSDYCSCCLESGKYLFDFSMEYLIYLWGLFPSSFNQVAGSDYNSEDLRKVLSERLPKLKRWKQRLDTIKLHYEIIIKVQAYINRHLFEDINSKTLSQIACMSVFHFRRIFKEAVGENVGDYIKRLRIEYIAFKIITTNEKVSQLLTYVNYNNKHTLSRAFKKHFQMTIPEFRKSYVPISNENKFLSYHTPTIKVLKETKIAYLKFEQTHRNSSAYLVLWEQVLRMAKENNLLSDGYKFVSISLDNLDITESNKCRFLIGVTIPFDFVPPKGFDVYVIPFGRFAIVRVQGKYYEMNKIYRDIYLDWLPKSNYRLREQMTFEIYENMPFALTEDSVLTSIYLPIEFK